MLKGVFGVREGGVVIYENPGFPFLNMGFRNLREARIDSQRIFAIRVRIANRPTKMVKVLVVIISVDSFFSLRSCAEAIVLNLSCCGTGPSPQSKIEYRSFKGQHDKGQQDPQL